MFWGAKKIQKLFKKYFSNRIEKLHKMASIFFLFLGLNFSYTVLYPLYSA